MKILFLFLAALAADGQTPGTIAVVNGAPAQAAVATKVTAQAGTEQCSIVGDTFPATKLTITCNINQLAQFTYTLPLAANAAYTFQHNYGTDAITAICRADAAGKITVSVTANGSPNNNIVF
jgi:hypothetical protein